MKKTKKLIILLTVLLIIIMMIIIAILMKLKDVNNDIIIEKEKDIVGSTDVVEEKSLKKVTIRDDYYTVKNIVDKYYYALCELNKTTDDIMIFENDGSNLNLEEIISKEKETTKKRIYDFFDEDCRKEIDLRLENIQEKLGNYNDIYISIEDMYVRDITIALKLYFVSGTITEKETTNKEEFEIVIGVDSNNSTFSIYTSEYAEKYKFKDKDKEFDINEIEKRTYNKYTRKTINNEEYAKDLLNSYTKSILYNNINYSYDRLNEEYNTKRFGEISEYEKYIQENRKSIIASTLEYYKTNICEDYIQYICVDTKGKYYIFNEKAIMDYDLILDLYTVDISEILEKYEDATSEEKAILNAQKITEALNTSDYKYLYSKLDTTFKNNKFSTVNDLQIYIETSVSKDFTIDFEELITEGDIYIYKAKIETKQLNLIIKLKDERDFVFSFSIE